MKRLTISLCALFVLMTMCHGEPLKSPEEAIKAFRAQWEAGLSKQLETSPYYKYLKHQIDEPERVSAVAESSEMMQTRITRDLGPKEMSLILYGKLSDLKPDRKVWVVVNPGAGPGFQAVLDQKVGSLILLWIIPEG